MSFYASDIALTGNTKVEAFYELLMDSLNHGRALFRAYPITYNRDFQMIICIAERRT